MVCLRAGHETGGLDMGRKESEDLRLACLLTSLTYLLQQGWLASGQGKSAGVGGWDSVIS